MIIKLLSLLSEIIRHQTTAACPQKHFQKRSNWQSEFLFVPEKRFYALICSRDFMRK